MTGAPTPAPQILSCSIAAARNVSPAASSTLRPSARKRAESLPMVVVLPEPFTPTTRMTNGLAPASITRGRATGTSTFSTSAARMPLTSASLTILSKRPAAIAAAMRAETSTPRSARISSSSSSSIVAASRLRLEDWFDHLRYGLPRGPELAHRLDRETSGCLVLGRHRKALASLSLLFKHRRIGKTYWAVVDGGPEGDEGTIDMPLGRLDPQFGWWMKPDPHGQPAVTRWKVMGRCPPQAGEGEHRVRSADEPHLTWLALEPVTGRTHQLRVHCAAMGFPIFGDDIYGNEASQRRARQIKFVARADAPGDG